MYTTEIPLTLELVLIRVCMLGLVSLAFISVTIGVYRLLKPYKEEVKWVIVGITIIIELLTAIVVLQDVILA